MIKVILFDLDDTLYPERDYIFQGFRAVSNKLQKDFNLDSEHVYKILVSIFESNRYRIFDQLADRLQESRMTPEYIEKEILPFYRNAPRQISCYSDVKAVLRELKKEYRLGLISNGRSEMQRAKIKMLGLDPFFDHIEISGDYRAEYAKPSPHMFVKSLSVFAISPKEAVYIGDHPELDGASMKAGIPFIRIRRPGGFYTNQSSPDGTWYEIRSLQELKSLFERSQDPR